MEQLNGNRNEAGRPISDFGSPTSLPKPEDEAGQKMSDAEIAQKKDEQSISMFFKTVDALVEALEAKDKYSRGHSHRVANIAGAIAQGLGLPLQTIDKIILAGTVHDIGNIGVRDEVFSKPGKLTEEEFQHVMSHCATGERILRHVVEDDDVLDMVRHHHEHYDGTGYPDGLSGKEGAGRTLSQNATIMCLAEAYEAITRERPYRGRLSKEEAEEEIRLHAGTQFDPSTVEALFRVISPEIYDSSQ